jgi:hypothetical protein
MKTEEEERRVRIEKSSYDISTGHYEGVSCLSFHHEDEEQLVPCGYIGELLGYKKEARSKLMSKKKC